MGGHRGSSGEVIADWSDRNELEFLKILLVRVQRDNNGTPSFKSTDWNEMDEELKLTTGVRFGAEKLKGKYNRFRIKNRLFSDLLAHTGVTFDASLNVLNAPEDVWQHFYKRNKLYKCYKNTGCKHYDLLGQVFNKSTATGTFGNSSTQPPPTFDEERDMEDVLFCGRDGEHEKDPGETSRGKKKVVNDDVGEGEYDIPKPLRVKKKKYRGENIEGFLDSWASTFETKKMAHAAIVELCARKTLTEASVSQCVVATSSVKDTSVEACMEELDKITGIDGRDYITICNEFKCDMNRSIFIKLSDDKKKIWTDVVLKK